RRHTRLQGDWSSDVCSSDLDANARDDRRGGETRIERAARERSVQSGDGFRGIEQGAPGEGERKQGEQEAEVRPSVRIRVGQPARSEERRVGKECRSRWSREQ